MRCPNCNAPVKDDALRTGLCEFCGAAVAMAAPASETTASATADPGSKSIVGAVVWFWVILAQLASLTVWEATDWCSVLVNDVPSIARVGARMGCYLPEQRLQAEWVQSGPRNEKTAQYFCVSPGSVAHYDVREGLLELVEVLIGLELFGLLALGFCIASGNDDSESPGGIRQHFRNKDIYSLEWPLVIVAIVLWWPMLIAYWMYLKNRTAKRD